MRGAVRDEGTISVAWPSLECALAAYRGRGSSGGGAAQGGQRGLGCSESCRGEPAALANHRETRAPSVNLEESKVGEEGGSLQMGPGEGADPQGGPWPQGQQPGHLAETELGPEGTGRCGRELLQAAQGQRVIHQQVQLQVDSLPLIKVHLGGGRGAESRPLLALGSCPAQTPSSSSPTFNLPPPLKPSPSPSVPALPVEPGGAYLTVQVVQPSPGDHKLPALVVIAQWVGAVDFGLFPATHRPVHT